MAWYARFTELPKELQKTMSPDEIYTNTLNCGPEIDLETILNTITVCLASLKSQIHNHIKILFKLSLNSLISIRSFIFQVIYLET